MLLKYSTTVKRNGVVSPQQLITRTSWFLKSCLRRPYVRIHICTNHKTSYEILHLMFIYMAAGGFFLPSQGDSFAGNDVTLIGQVATFAVGGAVVFSGEKTTEVDSYKTRCIIMGFQLPTNWWSPDFWLLSTVEASDRFGFLNLFIDEWLLVYLYIGVMFFELRCWVGIWSLWWFYLTHPRCRNWNPVLIDI